MRIGVGGKIVLFLLVVLLIGIPSMVVSAEAGESSFFSQLNPEMTNDSVDQESDISGKNTFTTQGSQYGYITMAPEYPVAGSPVFFSLNKRVKCVDPTYYYSFGDGEGYSTKVYDESVRHVYAKPGRYTVTVGVECLESPSAGVYDTLIVNVSETTIKITPKKPLVGGIILFSLDGSFPQGTVFLWDFGDGTPVMRTTANLVSHQYTRSGRYSARVSVDSVRLAGTDLDLSLQVGDIFVHNADSTVSKLIPGAWSHAALYIGDDKVVEAVGDGVRICNLYPEWSSPHDTCVAAFRLPDVSAGVKDSAVQSAKGWVRHPYDLGSIIGLTKQMPCNSEFLKCYWYYCSELVWAAYNLNKIDLDPVIGPVLPKTVVNGEHAKTVVVGAHVEKIPQGSEKYRSYYDKILNGQFAPPSLSGSDPDYEFILAGMNPVINDSAKINMNLTSPNGKILSTSHISINNSSIYLVDIDGDGHDNDEIGYILNPEPGEYLLNLSLSNQSHGVGMFSLGVGAWNDFQYSWLYPLQNITPENGSKMLHLRTDHARHARAITVPCRGPAPLNVSLMEISGYENSRNTWNFEDGLVVSDAKTISHLFETPGSYHVMLNVWNATSSSSISIPVEVTTSERLKADFSSDLKSGIPPLTVSFTDTSAGKPSGWNWTFGDGTHSHDKNPVHTYVHVGRYTVTLAVTNAEDQDTVRKPAYITTTYGNTHGARGILSFSSLPSDARVFVDSRYLGTTPIQVSGIPAGVRKVDVAKEGYQNWTGSVVVNQGWITIMPPVILRKE